MTSFFLSVPQFKIVHAQNRTTHSTIIINQVRGNECCGAGGLNELKHQIEIGEQYELPLTFTIRYDALQQKDWVELLINAQSLGMELGGFLEITPELAAKSGVEYHGDETTWYEAQYVYLIGYQPTDRIKIIDTYMESFFAAFGKYPKVTTAWIIDTPSLQYLKEKYGVQVHQITREQWGTDSYTMWGGPPHMPYEPSENWAFVPSATRSGKMPLIVRQTISDPVWNYGDTTNSYTSQPNDYGLEGRGFDYFIHLFEQTHNQPTQTQTFALIGLENSMPTLDQEEFTRQLKYVSEWVKKSGNHVFTASAFAEKWTNQIDAPLTIHTGTDKDVGSQNQSWWITTPKYRARLRFNANTLYLTDLRLYDPQSVDPYTTRVAEKLAYWVTPFVLDGARFWQNDAPKTFHAPHSDQLEPRKENMDLPSRIILAENINRDELTLELPTNNDVPEWTFFSNNQPLISFAPDYWTSFQKTTGWVGALSELLVTWKWQDLQGTFTWGFTPGEQPDGSQRWYPFIHSAALEQEREKRYPYLFPELKQRPLDTKLSIVWVTNEFAQAGRNPVRLAFFPKDSYGYPTILKDNPTVTVAGENIHVEITTPSNQTGLIFVDLTSGDVQKTTVTISAEHYSSTHTVVFAPNCKQTFAECIRHPVYFWWHLQNWSGDRYRMWLETQK